MLLGSVIVAIAIALVALILAAGIYTLWKGGEVAANWSNWLMRMRVLFQFIAIIIIMAVLYLYGQH
jgi:hypothetical protein